MTEEFHVVVFPIVVPHGHHGHRIALRAFWLFIFAHQRFVSDIAVFVLERDVNLQPTNHRRSIVEQGDCFQQRMFGCLST